MTKVALMFPGEMGSGFARSLIKAGHSLISPLEGRSDETRSSAKDLGIEDCGSYEQAVEDAEIVLSLVPAGAVLEVAEAVAKAAKDCEGRPVFLDLNAKSLDDLRQMKSLFDEVGMDLVNGCIIGKADRLEDEGRIYASGSDREPLIELFDGVIETIDLGEDFEAATLLKMSFAGFNKIVTASLFEIINATNHFEITESLLDLIKANMPGTLGELETLVPSYPRHGARRADEMKALATILEEKYLPYAMADAASQTLKCLAESESWTKADTGEDAAHLLSRIAF